MLFIFRKLRKSFFLPGKVRTYLAYAAGEIVLIVVGILLALQISEWNQGRRTLQKEISILDSIKVELTSDLNEISGCTRLHERSVRSAEVIIEHIEKDLPYKDSLQKHFFDSSNGSIFKYTASAFETLRALGVDLISNKQLRSQIINLYDSEYRYMVKMEDQLLDLETFRMNEVFRGRFDQAMYYTQPHGRESTGIMIPVDFEALKKETAFSYDIKTLRNLHKFYLERFCCRIQKMIEELIANIEQEIQRLE